MAELLTLSGVTKRFPGVVALDRVDFSMQVGEVHALIGENGAGKSTLINIIAGSRRQDEGRFTYRNQPLRHLTPHHARAIGISPVFQEFSLIPSLDVASNLFLGREESAKGVLLTGQMRRAARKLLDELGFDLREAALVSELPRAQQQMVEIAKALLQELHLLILDEPTASLTERETEKLFDLIIRLKNRGVGIIYVSHRMPELRRMADCFTILRDGKRIDSGRMSEVSDSRIVELMTGRKVDLLFPQIVHKPRSQALSVSNLTTTDHRVQDVSITLHAGEIVGIAGLVGCGKSEVGRAIFGLDAIETGKVLLEGQSVGKPTPRGMLDGGLCYFPSDRGAEGLALPRSIRENGSIAALNQPRFSWCGLLRRREEKIAIGDIAKRMQLRPLDIERPVSTLSGGNRQKVMLMRGLARPTQIFIFDEPTVGNDVGAKAEIYDLMAGLVKAGAAILLISSELPEILHLSHRVYVMREGHLVAEYTGEAITEAAILNSFFQVVATGTANAA